MASPRPTWPPRWSLLPPTTRMTSISSAGTLTSGTAIGSRSIPSLLTRLCPAAPTHCACSTASTIRSRGRSPRQYSRGDLSRQHDVRLRQHRELPQEPLGLQHPWALELLLQDRRDGPVPRRFHGRVHGSPAKPRQRSGQDPDGQHQPGLLRLVLTQHRRDRRRSARSRDPRSGLCPTHPGLRKGLEQSHSHGANPPTAADVLGLPPPGPGARLLPGLQRRLLGQPPAYERDRGLFQTYMPLIKTVVQAGWKPVNYTTSSSTSTLIERFGNPSAAPSTSPPRTRAPRSPPSR